MGEKWLQFGLGNDCGFVEQFGIEGVSLFCYGIYLDCMGVMIMFVGSL